jgi:hypothetical protein
MHRSPLPIHSNLVAMVVWGLGAHCMPAVEVLWCLMRPVGERGASRCCWAASPTALNGCEGYKAVRTAWRGERR